jgi:thiol-disulfide isomerase/thioredoxin
MRRTLLLVLVALLPLGAARGEDWSQYQTADALWDRLQTMENVPWAGDPTQYREQLGNLRSGLQEFETRFRSDPRRWDCKLLRVQVASVMARVDGRAPDNAAALQASREIIEAPDAGPVTKADARFLAATIDVETLTSSGRTIDAAARAAVDADLAGLRKDYPEDRRTDMLRLQYVHFLKLRDPVAAESMVRELRASQNLRVAALAQQELAGFQKTRELNGAPLDLKFKALDGTFVDLVRLRGKVVLVDFWATWCGPCRMEMPNVVATYNQLHKDGFEIVGISLDQSKDRLIGYAKQAGISWPQYFDGKGWQNDISSRYGVNSIPSAWLVDKKGFVRATDARGGDLTDQVKVLLAE